MQPQQQRIMTMTTNYIWEPDFLDQMQIINNADCTKNTLYMWLIDESDTIDDAHWIVKIAQYKVIFYNRKDAKNFQNLIQQNKNT